MSGFFLCLKMNSIDHIIDTGTIGKKDICHLLGLVFPDGRCNNDSLNRLYFTDDLLIDLGLTREQYKATRIFDRVKTKIIIGRLQLHLVRPRLILLIR